MKVHPYDSVAEQMTDLLRERKGKVWVREGEEEGEEGGGGGGRGRGRRGRGKGEKE